MIGDAIYSSCVFSRGGTASTVAALIVEKRAPVTMSATRAVRMVMMLMLRAIPARLPRDLCLSGHQLFFFSSPKKGVVRPLQFAPIFADSLSRWKTNSSGSSTRFSRGHCTAKRTSVCSADPW